MSILKNGSRLRRVHAKVHEGPIGRNRAIRTRTPSEYELRLFQWFVSHVNTKPSTRKFLNKILFMYGVLPAPPAE